MAEVRGAQGRVPRCGPYIWRADPNVSGRFRALFGSRIRTYPDISGPYLARVSARIRTVSDRIRPYPAVSGPYPARIRPVSGLSPARVSGTSPDRILRVFSEEAAFGVLERDDLAMPLFIPLAGEDIAPASHGKKNNQDRAEPRNLEF